MDAITGSVPMQPVSPALPQKEQAPEPKKVSLFSKKGKQRRPVEHPSHTSQQPPVTVLVELDDAYFRTETEYGLMETLRKRAVTIRIEVR